MSPPNLNALSHCCSSCCARKISRAASWCNRSTGGLVQKLAPKIPTVYLTVQAGAAPTVSLDKASAWSAGFNPSDHGKSLPRTVKAAGGAIWSPHFGDVTPELIAESHALGLQVVVWTVNKPADMKRLIAMGVDGIISDSPDLLRKAAAEGGIALPAGSKVAP
jgi:glycerophosphoryl diester phosphodiesterase